jgi:hypothetical protein
VDNAWKLGDRCTSVAAQAKYGLCHLQFMMHHERSLSTGFAIDFIEVEVS